MVRKETFNTLENIQYSIYFDDEINEINNVVYLPLTNDLSLKFYEQLLSKLNKKIILVVIFNFEWNDYMTPWFEKQIFKNQKAFGGHAEKFLNILLSNICPFVESFVKSKNVISILGGYSLSGLFALYSLTKTNKFTKAFSASGSLWYPGFSEYFENNLTSISVKKIYLSLGNQESNSNSNLLKEAGKHTENVYKLFKNANFDVFFEYNKGNHFVDVENRIIKAISYLVSD